MTHLNAQDHKTRTKKTIVDLSESDRSNPDYLVSHKTNQDHRDQLGPIPIRTNKDQSEQYGLSRDNKKSIRNRQDQF